MTRHLSMSWETEPWHCRPTLFRCEHSNTQTTKQHMGYMQIEKTTIHLITYFRFCRQSTPTIHQACRYRLYRQSTPTISQACNIPTLQTIYSNHIPGLHHTDSADNILQPYTRLALYRLCRQSTPTISQAWIIPTLQTIDFNHISDLQVTGSLYFTGVLLLFLWGSDIFQMVGEKC